MARLAGTARAFAMALVIGVGSGCGTAPPGTPAAVDAWLLPPDPTATETSRILLADPIDPRNAPVPSNDSERILFSHVYVGLTALDPDDLVQPMLAERISPQSELLWSIRLRPGLRFSDGTSLHARDVTQSWLLAARRHPHLDVWRLFDPMLVRAQGTLELLVRTKEPDVDLPRLLAEPAFSIVSYRFDDTLPVGAGRLASPLAPMKAGDNLLRPSSYYAGRSPVDLTTWNDPDVEPPRPKISSATGLPVAPSGGAFPGADRDGLREVLFHLDPGEDVRDAAGAELSVDAVLVREMDSVRFLDTAGFVSAPLPYDRGYVLLLVGPVPAAIDRQELVELTSTEDARVWLDLDVAEERTEVAAVREVLLLRAGDDSTGSRPAQTGRPRGSELTGFGPIDRAGLEEAARIGARLAAAWSAQVTERTEDARHERLRPGQAVVVPVARGSGAAHLAALPPHWFDLESGAQVGIVSLLESRPHLLSAPSLRGVRLDGHGVPRFERSGRSPSGGPGSPPETR